MEERFYASARLPISLTAIRADRQPVDRSAIVRPCSDSFDLGRYLPVAVGDARAHADVERRDPGESERHAESREMVSRPQDGQRPDHRRARDRRDRQSSTAEQLQRLQVTRARDVKHRRVELRCGSHVFSVADNWYVPRRLTAEMNTLLETSETPFGKVVQALRPYRRTLSVTLLWSPLPAGWEQRRGASGPSGDRTAPLVPPKDLFEHRAVLYTSDHQPFSEVDERYQGQLLAFSRNR